MRDFSLIIFDCDGTLVDSEYLNNSAMIALLNDMGVGEFDVEYSLTHFMGKSTDDIVRQVAAEKGIAVPSDYRARFIAHVEKGRKAHLKRIEGALRAVKAVAGAYPVMVASNGERPNVLASLEVTELAPFFPPARVVTKDDVENAKPAPDIYLHAADLEGVLPEKCLVIEDSEPGVMAAKAAGMTCWGFTGVHHEPEIQRGILEKAGADAVLTQLIHIPEHLGMDTSGS